MAVMMLAPATQCSPLMIDYRSRREEKSSWENEYVRTRDSPSRMYARYSCQKSVERGDDENGKVYGVTGSIRECRDD